MTCIVGIEHDDGVTIGADSAGSNDDITVARADTKLFRVGPYLFGFTTSFRMGQLIHYAFNPSNPDPRDLERHMVTSFIDELRECLTKGGYAEKDNGVESGGTFLVGVAGKLFCIQSDYQVARNIDGHNACGSGEYFAMGSLHSTARFDIRPRERVKAALEAAATYNPFVGPPFTIKTLAA